MKLRNALVNSTFRTFIRVIDSLDLRFVVYLLLLIRVNLWFYFTFWASAGAATLQILGFFLLLG